MERGAQHLTIFPPHLHYHAPRVPSVEESAVPTLAFLVTSERTELKLKISSTNTLLRMAKLILTLNKFSFDFSHFLQVKGLAMGSHMDPSNASVFTNTNTILSSIKTMASAISTPTHNESSDVHRLKHYKLVEASLRLWTSWWSHNFGAFLSSTGLQRSGLP